MTGAPWLMHAVTAAMLLIAAYCVARLITARLWHRDTDHAVDAVHIAMGVAMAGMIVPRWDPLPARTWEVIFAVAALWFGGLAIRDGRHLPHVLGSAAMLYMYAVASDAPSMSGMSMAGPSSGIPVVSAALALALLSYVWRTATQLAGVAESTYCRTDYLAPRLAACCEIAMGLAMAYPLLEML